MTPYRVVDHYGYVRVYRIRGGWQYEHRLIASAMIGRSLKHGEAVHHRNERKSDNRPDNLEVLACGTHVAHHNATKPKRPRGVLYPNDRNQFGSLAADAVGYQSPAWEYCRTMAERTAQHLRGRP